MALHPQARRALELLDSLPATLTMQASRERYERASALVVGPPEEVARVWDADADGVPVRVYEPEGAVGTLVFLHGGGWVVGSLDSHDVLCRALAARSGAAVVAVDYRLAPEHPYPAAVDDGERALRWTARERGGPLAVGGDSAGGTIAAVLARRARDLGLALQLLVYPPLDAGARHDGDPEGGFTRAEMDEYWDHYVPDRDARSDPDASPAAAEDLSGLAPAVVLLAEADPLTEEGRAYAARLDEATVTVVPGTAHGFVRWGGVFEGTSAALDEVAAALRAALRTP